MREKIVLPFNLTSLVKPFTRLSAVLFSFIILFVSQPVFAQTSDLDFANYYYDNGEFEKSALYFSKLYGNIPNPYYYQRLLSCFINQEKYDDAEDLAKKQLKNTESKSDVYTDLAAVYSKSGNQKKKAKALEDVLDNLPPNRNGILTIAKKLVQYGEVETAEACYLRGITLLNGDYNFALELADIYGAKGNLPKMVEAYIELVAANPAYMPSVQNMLDRYLNLTEEPERGDLVKTAVLRAIQKNPENTSLNEMLVWLFYQVKNYPGAFIQLKALDKRFNETGNRIIEFSELCIRNQEYATAITAFNYLLESNKDAYITELSLVGKSRAEFLTLEELQLPDKKIIDAVDLTLSSAIKNLGISTNTVGLIIDYSNFLVKYRNQLDSAIQLLEEVIERPNIAPSKTAEVKLLLGDYLIIKGEIWDASLYYSQVDKDFKNDALGAEAKFRNAKVSYYTGDFDWAQDQLDVLKISTSKLISNDALNLSLLITDNLGLDSLEEPLQLFALADLYVFQNLLTEAEKQLDTLSLYYPGHRLADEILFEKAEIAKKRKDFIKAATYLTLIVEQYPTDILGDDAVFELAELYRKQLQDPTKASTYYQKIITEFPSSLYVIEARKRFRELRGDNLSKPN